jgi:hypothetical protein
VRKVLALLLAIAALGAVGSASATSAFYKGGPVFQTPSHNIRCVFWSSAIDCHVVNRHQVVSLPYDSGRTSVWYVPGGPVTGGSVMEYGQRAELPGLVGCISRFNGLTCRSKITGHGFFASRDAIVRF